MQKLFPRLLGVVAIHAVLGALAWILERWLFVRQDGLAVDLLTRIDGDPVRADAYLADVGGSVLTATAASMALSAVLACAWLVALHRRPPYGDKSARSRRGSWSALLLVGLVGAAGVFWERLVGTAVIDLLASGVAMKAALVGVGAVVVAYWSSTAALAPTTAKVAVPGASLLPG